MTSSISCRRFNHDIKELSILSIQIGVGNINVKETIIDNLSYAVDGEMIDHIDLIGIFTGFLSKIIHVVENGTLQPPVADASSLAPRMWTLHLEIAIRAQP